MRPVVALALAAALSVSSSASAAVRFEDWRQASLSDVASRAAREQSLVVLVVSQPDWCPPCILLDAKWLKNPADTEVADMTRNAIVLEVNGYDQPEAGVLAKHGIAFRGTPTTFVLAPQHEHEPLGAAKHIGSIVGAPADYPAQLRSLLQGEDPVEALERRIDQQGRYDKVQRAKDYIELGDLRASRGDGVGAYLNYRHVRRLQQDDLTVQEAAQLRELKRDAAWRMADTVKLRVAKDYTGALQEIATYENMFPHRAEEQATIAYSKAWALANKGRVSEALSVLDAGLPDTADGADTYMYFCFRSGHRTALVAGERKVREALWRWPERRGEWKEASGRIARRQGRLEDAELAFGEALSLATDPEEQTIYQAQLEHVRAELAARLPGGTEAATKKVSQDAHSHDGSEHGRDPRGLSTSLGR